jgi:hypothetical protein
MPPRILLYRDATIDCPIREIVGGLNRMIVSCTFELGNAIVEIPGTSVSLASYSRLPSLFLSEAGRADYVFIATRKRYENNYFFHTESAIAIISFSDWDLITKVPIANGLVLFIIELLALSIGAGVSHDDSRGCIHDFRRSKAHADFAMKAAFICNECREQFERCKPNDATKRMFAELCCCLDDLSACSRDNADIAEHWRTLASRDDRHAFDVFLCHNSAEKDEVRQLCRRLKSAGVRPWFDEDQLRVAADFAGSHCRYQNCRGSCGVGWPWSMAGHRGRRFPFGIRQTWNASDTGYPGVVFGRAGAACVPQNANVGRLSKELS